MIDILRRELGSLDYLYFAFPQVSDSDSGVYDDPSVFVASAIAVARNHQRDSIKARVNPPHPLSSDYVRIDGISATEIVIPTNVAKKMLRYRPCLVIEKWGDEFVCRVPNRIRDGINEGTISVLGIPRVGHIWSLSVVRKLQETCKQLATTT